MTNISGTMNIAAVVLIQGAAYCIATNSRTPVLADKLISLHPANSILLRFRSDSASNKDEVTTAVAF